MSNLQNNCKKTKELINESIGWIKENIDADKARPILSTLKDLRADARNLELSADGRPTLGVYGESQIGKSYFMSELLKNKQENRFYLKFKPPHPKYNQYFTGEHLDFLSRVNPDGGKESSGIVTRFTIDQDDQRPDAQIPVKFLRQVDLAMILTDTYALDINNTDHLNDYEYKDIVNILQELSSFQSTTNIDGMDESDVVDYKNYLNKYLKDRFSTIYLFNKNKLWDSVIELLPKIPYNQRYRVFELFWGRIPVLTEVFSRLSEVLKQIDFAKSGHVELDAILPKETMNSLGDIVKSSIIDVGTLADFYSLDKLSPINIHTERGVIPNIGLGEATAIVREMTLSIDDRILEEDSRKFLDSTDVYDFPGARTRKEYDVARIESLSSISDSESGSKNKESNILHECITRGKVNYLFNYYADMSDVTTLIFGQKDSNQEVNSLPMQINNWVVNTHGSTPQERDGEDCNLFISFNFFNKELDGKPANIPNDIQQYNGLWTNRLGKNVEEFIGKQIREDDNWVEQWTENKRFSNFLFLRDPEFSKATTLQPDGTEIYNAGYEQKHKEMKQSFLTTPAVKKYIKNPLELWENSASLNNTGTEYIVKQISPVTTMARRREQIESRLEKVLVTAIQKVTPFHKSGDYDDALEVVKQKTTESLHQLMIAMKTKNNFGSILYNFELDEDLAWKTLYDIENPIFDYSIGKDGSMKNTSSQDNIDGSNIIDINIGDIADFLGVPFGDESEKKSTIDNIDTKHKTKAEIFVDKLLADWTESTTDKFNQSTLKKLGIDRDTADWISQNLMDSFYRTNFKEFILSKINNEIKQYIQNPESIFLISRLSRNHFNNFINTYGWNHSAINERPRSQDNSLLFSNEEKNGNTNYIVKVLTHDKIKLDDSFPGLQRFIHWLQGFQVACKENLDYKYADGGVISNPEENTKLGTIIESFKHIE